MFILFGFGHRTVKEYGPTLPTKCSNCNNSTFWRLSYSRSWFTLFFIPIIPYQSKYYLLCEICSRGMELEGPQIEKAKQLNRLTRAFLAKQISEEKYFATVERVGILE